jgi:hypothetical protein
MLDTDSALYDMIIAPFFLRQPFVFDKINGVSTQFSFKAGKATLDSTVCAC